MLHVNTKINANLDELQNDVDIFDETVISRLEEGLVKLEASRMEAVLELSQNLRSAFLGIAGKIRMKHPLKYDKIIDSWESQFAEAEMKVTVSARLERTYDIGRSL